MKYKVNRRSNSLMYKNYNKVSCSYLLKLISGIMLLSISFSIMSCVPIYLRERQLGDAYSKQKTTMVAPASDQGRLFIYIVGGGLTPFGSGIGAYCMVDNQIYRLIGNSYFSLDLQALTHKIAVDGSTQKKVKEGKNALEFDLKAGEVKYCRLEFSGYGVLTKFNKPVLVEPKVAESELADLRIMENPKDL